MSPDQKQQLVQELQGIGYYVGKLLVLCYEKICILNILFFDECYEQNP